MSGTSVDTIEGLEEAVGRKSPAMDLKVIDHLDEWALRWIASSPLAFLGLAGGGRVDTTLAGDCPGFCRASSGSLAIPRGSIDASDLPQVGDGFGSLFVVPGLGETLRVNGRVAEVTGEAVVVSVGECFMHCAKAMIRSDFWGASPSPDAAPDLKAFVAAGKFMALVTDGDGVTVDVSPKGDPAGSLTRMDGGSLWFADRPGNRRTDSFRNILQQPKVACLIVVPGSNFVASVRGEARLTTDEARRAAFSVNGRSPLLAVEIAEVQGELLDSGALARAALWGEYEPADDLDPAKIFAAHMRLNRDKGLTAKVASVMVSIPGMMSKGLERDYKTRLY